MTRWAKWDGRAVFERSGWQCQMPVCLCPDGRALDPELVSVDGDWMPTVDHIVPRKFSGGNLPRNMRAAHKRCNNKAGTW